MNAENHSSTYHFLVMVFWVKSVDATLKKKTI